MLQLKNENEKRTNEIYSRLQKILPRKIFDEIERLGAARADFPRSLCEVTLRAEGRCSAVISGENIPLFSKLCEEEINLVFERITESSLYAHVKDISGGFVTLPFGVRVGICASLSCGGSALGKIGSLVFRIPIGRCAFANELFDHWVASGMGGMLLYSLPGAGKTSALRALCGEISRRLLKKVVIVDERCEFIASDYSDATVDILQGYTKARGLEIALRTLSPDVIVVDEIGSFDEAESLLKVGRGGVPIIASAHAESYAELACKAGISTLAEEGYFSSFVHLFRKGGKFGYEIN